MHLALEIPEVQDQVNRLTVGLDVCPADGREIEAKLGREVGVAILVQLVHQHEIGLYR